VDARTVTIILRLIHILAGIFWAGTAFLVAGFLVPTARARGREGGLFLQDLMLKRRLSDSLGVAMLLTVLSGLGMYIRLAVASHGTWPRTPPGIAYGVGAVAAIAAGVVGAYVGGAGSRRMAAIGASIGPGGPSPEQQSEMGRLQARIGVGTRIAAGLLALAASAMAAGRYL
jgi:uncharacterized membrane protein